MAQEAKNEVVLDGGRPVTEGVLPWKENKLADLTTQQIAASIGSILGDDQAINDELANLEQKFPEYAVSKGDPRPVQGKDHDNQFDRGPGDDGSMELLRSMMGEEDKGPKPKQGSKIEQAEEQEQAAGRAAAPAPEGAEAPKPGGRVRVGEREFSEAQVEAAIRMAERNAEIEQALIQRQQQLEQWAQQQQQGQRVDPQEQALWQASGGDPTVFARLKAAMNPERRQEIDDDYDPWADDDEQSTQQRGLTPEQVEQIVQQRLQHHQMSTAQQSAMDNLFTWIGEAVDKVIGGVDEFKHLPEEVSDRIGRKIGEDLRYGVNGLAWPDVARGVRGPTKADIEKAAARHAKDVLLERRAMLDEWTATRRGRVAKVADGMPSPATESATILPGQDRNAAASKMPDTVDDLIAQVTRIAEEQTRHTNTGF